MFSYAYRERAHTIACRDLKGQRFPQRVSEDQTYQFSSLFLSIFYGVGHESQATTRDTLFQEFPEAFAARVTEKRY